MARKFHRAGHEVIAADSYTPHFCHFSRAVKRSYRIPSPKEDAKGFNDALIEIIEREKIDLFLPVFHEIFFVASARHRYPKSCQIVCDAFDKLVALDNKWLFQQKIKALNWPVPESVLIHSSADFSKLDPDGVWAIKPCFASAAEKLYKIRGDKLPISLDFSPYNPWIAQRWVEGTSFCCYGVCQEGKLLAHVVYPVSFAINRSSCLTFRAIDHPAINLWVESLVKKEQFTGQIAFDFVETADGTLYPIECNPRGTSGIHLFDHNDRLDRAFFGQQVGRIVPKNGRCRQLVVGMIMYGWRGEQSFASFLRMLLTTKDVVFRFWDPLPFLALPCLFWVILRLSRQLGMPMPFAFFHDIEWNGDKKILEGGEEVVKAEGHLSS